MSRISITNIFLILLFAAALLLGPHPARAQGPQTLVKNDLESNVLVAPDFKLTDLGGDLTGMAGLYGGWLINQKLLIGGGGYFQTNQGDVSDMKYGGAVLEYFFHPSQLLNVSVRGLVGGGTATIDRFGLGRFPILRNGIAGLDDRLSDLDRFDGDRRLRGRLPDIGTLAGIDLGDLRSVDETFLVAEPEINATLNVTEKFRIGFGAGYRFIGAANGLEDQLDGFTANLAAQFRF